MQAFAREIDAKAPGTTFKEVSGKIVAGVPFPLPPLAEQRRIVEKVDELMALCDRLEAARTVREQTRGCLTKASYAGLNAPDTDDAAFRVHTGFAVDAFHALTAHAVQIESLRQTILNLAVRGKLVRRKEAEGDASSLVKSIQSDSMQAKRSPHRTWHSASKLLHSVALDVAVSGSGNHLWAPKWSLAEKNK